MISEGELNAALFIGVYYGNKQLDNLREVFLELAENPEMPKDILFKLLAF